MTGALGGDSGDARLHELRRRYPRWRIWHGRVTGEYWAMPPRDHPTQRELISAPDLDRLAWRLAEAEGRLDG